MRLFHHHIASSILFVLLETVVHVKSNLLALYRLEEIPDDNNPDYFVIDSTNNSEGSLYGGTVSSNPPIRINGAWPNSRGWNFGAGPKGIAIAPTETTSKFGENTNGGDYASGGATIAFAMKKNGSTAFTRILTGPSVDIYELKNYISVTVGGVTITAPHDVIYDGDWHTHVIVIQWKKSILHYVDGVLHGHKDGNPQHESILSLTVPWRIARRNAATNGDCFQGGLDDFCIFNHAFDDSEVSLYHSSSGSAFLPKSPTRSPSPTVGPMLLALYRFEEVANANDPDYSVVDSTSNSEGFLYGGSNNNNPPERINGAWSNSKGWNFGAGPKGISILPTKVTSRFGESRDGSYFASGGATIAFAMKKNGSTAFTRILTGPSVDFYELKNYVSVTVGGVTVTAPHNVIYDGNWHTHVIVVKWGESISHYVDGVLHGHKDGNPQHESDLSLTVPWRLARRNAATNGDGFQGGLDDFCIFNYAFDDNEVSLYHSSSGTAFLSDFPTRSPSPSVAPTVVPTVTKTSIPSNNPTSPTGNPTNKPSLPPSRSPTNVPTKPKVPTNNPTLFPTTSGTKLLALYRFEEVADANDPDFYSVVDSTSNSEGFLYGGSNNNNPPEMINGAWSDSKGWNFGAGPKGITILPTEVTSRFGESRDGEEYASGGATIAFAMKKNGSTSFQRILTGPSVDLFELNDYISVNVGGVTVAVSHNDIYDGNWHTHVISVKWEESISHYVDGVLHGHKSSTPQHRSKLSLMTPWRIARRNKSTNGNGFQGALDDFCIFNHAFGESEVALYHSSSGAAFEGDQLKPKQRTYYMDPNIHPRVLLRPQDIPSFRERARISSPALNTRNFFEGKLNGEEGFDHPTSNHGKLYQKLVNCADEDFSSYTTLSSLGYGKDFFTMEYNFMWKAAFALVDDDSAKLSELGEALSCWAGLVYPLYTPNINNFLTHDNFFATAMAYDWVASLMSSTQREPVIKILSKATRHRVTYGCDLEWYEINSNWHSHHDHIALSSLAIEGQEGYDPLLYDRTVEKQRHFYTGGVFESGFTHEGWVYFEMGQEGGGPFLLSSVLRGEDLLETTYAKNALTAAFWQLSPWSKGLNVNLYSYSDGAGPAWSSRSHPYGVLFRHLYPDDPLIKFHYKLLTEHRRNDRMADIFWYLFSVEPDEDSGSFQSVADEKKLGLSHFCPDSGHSVFRSDWSEDALLLQFHARMDQYQLGHVHADINHFSLFANGKQWISDSGYHTTNNDHHSTVLIDGLGQSGTTVKPAWPTLPGKFVDYFDNQGTFAHAVGDASFAYTYYRTYRNQIEPWMNEEFHNPFTWGAGFANYSEFYYPYNFDGSPRNMNNPSQSWKKDMEVASQGGYYNPVNFAFRTVIISRGTYPYMIVLDDIQAEDRNEHDYTQLFQIRQGQGFNIWDGHEPLLYKQLSSSEPATITDAVLQFSNYQVGDPDLVVRVIQGEGVATEPISIIHLPDGSHYGDNSYALQINRRTNLPSFKTILYPRKNIHGPKLITNFESGVLTVKINDQVDEFVFSTNEDGRTIYSATRSNDSPTASPTIPSSTPTTSTPTTNPFCTDDTTWNFKGKKCNWVREDMKRCKKRDKKTKVIASTACPIVCKSIECVVPKCKHNKKWKTIIKRKGKKEDKKCTYLKKKNKDKKYCGNIFFFKDLELFGYEACEFCDLCTK